MTINCSRENRVVNQITETACLQNKVINSKIRRYLKEKWYFQARQTYPEEKM